LPGAADAVQRAASWPNQHQLLALLRSINVRKMFPPPSCPESIGRRLCRKSSRALAPRSARHSRPIASQPPGLGIAGGNFWSATCARFRRHSARECGPSECRPSRARLDGQLRVTFADWCWRPFALQIALNQDKPDPRIGVLRALAYKEHHSLDQGFAPPWRFPSSVAAE